MKPQVNKKLIRNPWYKYSWVKAFVKMLRNKKQKDFRNKHTIHLS